MQALVGGCLQLAPDERLTANEALANPFFSVSSVTHHQPKELLESAEKIEILRRQARLLRKPGAFALHVRRNALVRDTIDAFSSMDANTLAQPFHVHFIGEPAIGEGLVSEFYSSFFSGVSSMFFERGLPRANCEEFSSLRVVGMLLGRCIVDGCSIGPHFGAPSLFKFLLGHPCTLSDLEMYDTEMTIGLRNLYLQPVEEGTLFFAGGGSGGVGGGSIMVSDANKREFVEQKVQAVLVDCRLPQLRAVASGFEEVVAGAGLSSALEVFSAAELALVLSGETHIDGHMVASSLRFAGWDPSSSTPGHLVGVLQELSAPMLRRFLILCTSSCSLGHAQPPITIQRCPPSSRLPVGRTCFRRLDLPAFEDRDVLREKLLLALTLMGDTFTLS